MSFKPEQVCRNPYMNAKSMARRNQGAKKALKRKRRQMERKLLGDTPIRMVKGYAD